jgi:hypothetical protein
MSAAPGPPHPLALPLLDVVPRPEVVPVPDEEPLFDAEPEPLPVPVPEAEP